MELAISIVQLVLRMLDSVSYYSSFVRQFSDPVEAIKEDLFLAALLNVLSAICCMLPATVKGTTLVNLSL